MYYLTVDGRRLTYLALPTREAAMQHLRDMAGSFLRLAPGLTRLETNSEEGTLFIRYRENGQIVEQTYSIVEVED